MILKVGTRQYGKAMKYTVNCKEYPDIEGIGSSKHEAVADFHNKVEALEKAFEKTCAEATVEIKRQTYNGKEYFVATVKENINCLGQGETVEEAYNEAIGNYAALCNFLEERK